MADRAELSAVAQRCIDDPEYARTVLESEGYPEVQAALLADLGADPDVKGFLNPQPLPPFHGDDASHKAYARNDWGVLANRWSGMEFLQTRGIIIIGG
jgi:hypothetical protein